MEISQLYSEIAEFSKTTHGSSTFDKDLFFVQGKDSKEFSPFKYLNKKFENLKHPSDLLKMGFVLNSYDLSVDDQFSLWFEKQFSKKLLRSVGKNISILGFPNENGILRAVEEVDRCYSTLRQNQVILNGKNLPTQLGEWYAKCIFGLKQIKSTSQRGFDFELEGKRCEIKVHWSDRSSPKGVKIKKSLIELSEYCIIMYVAQNFMIREVCFLDSDFVIRKFFDRGHTVFLKDQDLSQYFFSKSRHNIDKVVNSNALLKFSSPSFAVKIAENFKNQ